MFVASMCCNDGWRSEYTNKALPCWGGLGGEINSMLFVEGVAFKQRC